jgi:sec-independent protein translocase protein TatB
MFDIGWSELLVIVVIAVLVIGPKDVPKIMHGFGRIVRRIQYARFAMTQQFDEILRAGDIDELRRGVNFEAPKTDERAADESLDEKTEPKP